MRFWLVALFLIPLARVYAQSPGTCEYGIDTAWLDINEVRAGLTTHAKLFEHGQASDETDLYYVVPRNRTCTALYSGVIAHCKLMRLISPWIEGWVNGERRQILSYYGPADLWPGPLETGGTLPNPTDCSTYDRIFVVSRDDVARYLETGEMTDDLRDWPAAWGAPVLDGDGIDGNYDLEAGDQPAIYGDQAAWWVMNDVGNAHSRSGSAPLGIEVQITAFAARSAMAALSQSTFYWYRIVNRNAQSIENLRFAVLVDLEYGLDDYVSADTVRDMGFVYNGDAVDPQFGIPPAMGVQIVQGPVGLPNGRDDDRDGTIDEHGERIGMTGLLPFYVGATGDPGNPDAFSYRMHGRWNDGTPITEGNGGYQTGGSVTTFYWPGDPLTAAFWSGRNVDGSGNEAGPTYQSFNMNTGPFRLEPEEAADIVLAIPFAQGTDWLDSVAELRLAADLLQNAWDAGHLAPTRVEAAPAPPEVPGAIELERPRPNPFTDRLAVRYTLPAAMTARVTLLDVLGREVATLASGEQPAGPHEVAFDAARLPAGLYLVRFEAGAEARTFTVVKAQ